MLAVAHPRASSSCYLLRSFSQESLRLSCVGPNLTENLTSVILTKFIL